VENARTANRPGSRATASPQTEKPQAPGQDSCGLGSPANAPFPAGSPAESPPAESSTAWRQWLAGGSPREVLARIVHEDPLGVREHVARGLRSGAWLLDGDRVLLRAFAIVARHAVTYRGRPDVDAWLAHLCEEAIASILREDGDAERRPAGPGTEPWLQAQGAAFAALARPLGLEPESMGRACLAFNRLPASERKAFFALVIAGRTLDELARESGETATDIARRARRALEAILAGAQPPATAQSAQPAATQSPQPASARAAPRVGPSPSTGRRSTQEADRAGTKRAQEEKS
jgi:DNA-directed RNA polymerase specialized sigma24 family protein